MAAASYRALCIDAVDAERLGAFWAAALGLEPRRRGDELCLEGLTPRHAVWVNEVPEPVTVKQRIHLDVHATSAEELIARGATPLDLDCFRWQVLRDPEGGELCAFGREAPPAYRLYEVVADARDAERIARWWADVLGGTVFHEDGDAWWSVEGVPGMPFEALVFQEVPEPKAAKNRIHWDVSTADVALLTAAGATVLRSPGAEIAWTVLADPEGNEFCAFPVG
jgi:hypothetical protein